MSRITQLSSDDPGPWADEVREAALPGPAEMARELEAERAEEEQRRRDATLWQRFAGRLTLEGDLTR